MISLDILTSLHSRFLQPFKGEKNKSPFLSPLDLLKPGRNLSCINKLNLKLRERDCISRLREGAELFSLMSFLQLQKSSNHHSSSPAQE